MNAAISIKDGHHGNQKLRVVRPASVCEYAALSNFIKTAYWHRYGATDPHLLPTLVALENEQNELIATCGLSLGSESVPFFLEQYLDQPVEQALAQQIGQPSVNRKQIVEVGNLSAAISSGGRLMIGALCQWFYQEGMEWVVFTGTNQLRNSFQRLGIGLNILADANPRRLADQGDSWGCYYHTQPKVMAGHIRTNYTQLTHAVDSASKNIFPLHLDVIASDEAG